jgi:hypothetical protein
MHSDTDYVAHQHLLKLFGLYKFDIFLWSFRVLGSSASSAEISFMDLLYLGEFFKDRSQGCDIETLEGSLAQSIN